jgi:hypothetical protein
MTAASVWRLSPSRLLRKKKKNQTATNAMGEKTVIFTVRVLVVVLPEFMLLCICAMGMHSDVHRTILSSPGCKHEQLFLSMCCDPLRPPDFYLNVTDFFFVVSLCVCKQSAMVLKGK